MSIRATDVTPNRTFRILSSTDSVVNQYAGKVYQVIDGDEVGVIGNPAVGSAGAPVAFFELNTVDVEFDPAGSFAFPALNAYSRIYDVSRNAFAKLGDFAPFLFEQAAPVTIEEDWTVDFQPGTIFRIDQTNNPSLWRFQGVTFKSRQVTDAGVLGIPAIGSGHEDPVFMPFDSETTYTLDPPGIYQFVEGIRPGARVYCTTSRSYVDVEYLYPTYFGYGYVAEPWGIVPVTVW